MKTTKQSSGMSRRTVLGSIMGSVGVSMALPRFSNAAEPGKIEYKDKIRITRLETFLVRPRWFFLKIHTDAGIVGLGEPLLEGRALTIQTAKERGV